MFPKFVCIVLFIIISNCFQQSSSRGYYTIVAPGTVRSHSIYHVSISLSDFHQSCWFNISMVAESGEFRKILETVEVEPRSTKLVKIQMPRLSYGQGRLQFLSYNGIFSANEGRINIEDRHYTVYIQTDKTKYKPGEMVQFRAMCIDRLTQPAKVVETLEILIYDGQRNLIKALSNVKLVQGVFRGNFHLSDYPVLGEWKIEVKANGLTMQEKSFQVAQYVLPKFSVDIITKEDVSLSEGRIVMKIKASYTYGEPVKGNLTVLLQTNYSVLGDQRPGIVRASLIDGETTISLDFKTDLNISGNFNEQHSIRLYTFGVEAMVQDSLTRQSAQNSLNIGIHSNPYKIKVKAPKTFDPKKLLNVTVSITDLQNNPVHDVRNPVKFTIEGTRPRSFWNPEIPDPKSNTAYLNENGVSVVSFDLSDEEAMEYVIVVEYRGWISHQEKLRKYEGNTFDLDILTETPKVGEDLVIQLRSIDPIEYFVYEIISRGDIIQSKHITVPGEETTYLFNINTTHAMVPKITLFVHRVKKNIFDSRLKEVYIKRSFQNTIEINTVDEVKPGTSVSFNVTTDEGSYVGLIGIDQKLLEDSKNKPDLTEDHIFTKLRNYDSINMNEQVFPGIEAGLLTFSNAFNRAGHNIGRVFTLLLGGEPPSPLPATFDNPSVELPRIRKLFSDSWIFKDFESTPLDGLKFNEIIPDTITSWAITGFSLNPNTGLTLTKKATKVKVFQEFFISMDLPSLVKEGEIIEIPVYVSNYMEKDLLTDVTIESQSEDLELLQGPTSKAGVQSNQTTSKSIPANGRVKLVFFIRPRKPGQYKVIIKAISPIASDAVEKTLSVKPEGIPYSVSKTFLVHLPPESEQNDELQIEIPENSVRGSETISLSVVGDIFGPLMRSLHELVRVPYGNGEENMRYFVSNLLVLKYLKALNYTNPSLESKINLHLDLGYQTQLTFKHLDGSFSLFDRTVERTGDIWLTAYTMWGLQHAGHFSQVDSKVINRGLGYLKSKQANDGSFGSGKGPVEDVALTALTMLAFLVDERNTDQYKDVINRGLAYLHEIQDDLEESTSSAVSIYALVLGKHKKSDELLRNLAHSAGVRSKRMIWTKQDTLQSNLETTANSFMTLLESQTMPQQSLLPIVKALISTEQAEKTPVYLIALEVMIKFAKDLDSGRKDLNIKFNDDQGVSGDIHVDSKNSQVLQEFTLGQASRKIRLQTKGNGFAVVNVKYGYNLLPDNQNLSNYDTNITIQEANDFILTLVACVALRSSISESNLTAMEVNMPTGYTVDDKFFEKVRENNDLVRSIQVNRNDGSVLVYLENLAQNGTCIQLQASKTYNVFDVKPISVVVYDVHNEDRRSVSFREIDL